MNHPLSRFMEAGTTAPDQEIDERVYRLYALTPDEIELVEETRE